MGTIGVGENKQFDNTKTVPGWARSSLHTPHCFCTEGLCYNSEKKIMSEKLRSVIRPSLPLIIGISAITACTGESEPVAKHDTGSVEVGTMASNDGYQLPCIDNPWDVYAQNSGNPPGAVGMNDGGESVSLAPNKKLEVVGWVATKEVVYPQNAPEFRGGHRIVVLVDGVPVGVDSSALRGSPTDQTMDEEVPGMGGEPVDTPAECEIKVN